jgi:hypothetical protein
MKSVNVQMEDKLFDVLSALAVYWHVSLDYVVERLLQEAARVSLEVTRGMGAGTRPEDKPN